MELVYEYAFMRTLSLKWRDRNGRPQNVVIVLLPTCVFHNWEVYPATTYTDEPISNNFFNTITPDKYPSSKQYI